MSMPMAGDSPGKKTPGQGSTGKCHKCKWLRRKRLDKKGLFGEEH